MTHPVLNDHVNVMVADWVHSEAESNVVKKQGSCMKLYLGHQKQNEIRLKHKT